MAAPRATAVRQATAATAASATAAQPTEARAMAAARLTLERRATAVSATAEGLTEARAALTANRCTASVAAALREMSASRRLLSPRWPPPRARVAAAAVPDVPGRGHP